MSKIIKSNSDGLSYGWGYVLLDGQHDYITGRLFTLLESFGFRENQEKAVKDIIRQEISAWFRDMVAISPTLNTAIRNIVFKVDEYNKSKSGDFAPISIGGSLFTFEITATETGHNPTPVIN